MTTILLYSFTYLAFAVAAVLVSKKLGLGSVLGYLMAGIAIGPVLGFAGKETESIQHVAEFGVVMMLFLVAVMMLLTACGPGEKKSKKGGGETVDASKFPIETTNTAPAVKDAVLRVAIVKDSPLIGIFYSNIGQGDGYDGELISTFFRNEIFDLDENFEITDTGMATLSVDAPNKKATIKIKDGIKWSDGQPLTADDIIFAYKVIGSKDYTGVRYNDDNEKVVGMKEYHEGKAQDISGLKKIDDNKAAVLLGLAYLNRYYGVKFDDFNIKELMFISASYFYIISLIKFSRSFNNYF